jgi:cytochrome P450
MKPSFSLKPFHWYQEMQQKKPVYYDPDFTLNWGDKGAWQVFRHKDVQTVLANYEVFSSESVPRNEQNPISYGLVNTDPPRHKLLRKIISKAFVPSVIKKLEPWIREQCHERLSAALEKGEMEFIKDFAIPIPVSVITKLLGVPIQDYKQVHDWANELNFDPEETEAGVEGFFRTQLEQAAFFENLIKEKERNLQDDLLSHLIQAEVDGEKLSQADLISFCIVLLTAGNETTTNLLGNMMLTFTEQPELQTHLLEHPQDIPLVIDEALRYRSPVQSLFRLAIKDYELNGHKIKKGDYVNVWLGSANHDPEVFPNPEVFDIHRNNRSQVSFGHGIHYCLGEPLAKMEAKIALEVLFQKVKQIQLKPNVVIERHPSAIIFCLKRLPITFEQRS